MIQRIKCCLYILMSKRYALFTADERKILGKRTHCEIFNSNTAFLSAIVSYVKELSTQFKDAGEQILEEIKK